jgi:3-phenylpropionate/trans-cinnamate dioxygenase ferredoxin reductase component
MSARRIVIVGASLAGATAAQGLREHGFDGSITLIGDEPDRPYERPPLSKEYLLGKVGREKVFVHPEGWYAGHGVDLVLSTEVTALDRVAHQVVLATGERLRYDSLLLTTGSTPRRLEVPGADRDGVFYLRRIADSERLRSAFTAARRVVIIGAGWVGLETASAARAAGLDVTLLETAELPLLRVLGPEVAAIFADLHRTNGVDLRTGVAVAELTGRHGTVTGVRLGDGSEVAADLVVLGVGISPNDLLARDAGLVVDNGIVVDEQLRTSDPDVFAAGDVANAYHPLLRRQVRVEHWANARRQGATAARTMLGQDAVYDRLPYFFSDQYDVSMEYTGYVEPGGYDRVVFRGDPASGKYIAFWLAANVVRAGMNVNVWDVSSAIEGLVRLSAVIDPDLLCDPSAPLPGSTDQ